VGTLTSAVNCRLRRIRPARRREALPRSNDGRVAACGGAAADGRAPAGDGWRARRVCEATRPAQQRRRRAETRRDRQPGSARLAQSRTPFAGHRPVAAAALAGREDQLRPSRRPCAAQAEPRWSQQLAAARRPISGRSQSPACPPRRHCWSTTGSRCRRRRALRRAARTARCRRSA